MQNFWTIFRRELAAYYTSAIGYIFLIVFLSLSVGLFMTPFFTFLSADMRAFFFDRADSDVHLSSGRDHAAVGRGAQTKYLGNAADVSHAAA